MKLQDIKAGEEYAHARSSGRLTRERVRVVDVGPYVSTIPPYGRVRSTHFLNFTVDGAPVRDHYQLRGDGPGTPLYVAVESLDKETGDPLLIPGGPGRIDFLPTSQIIEPWAEAAE